jgi:hypothetical protein
MTYPYNDIDSNSKFIVIEMQTIFHSLKSVIKCIALISKGNQKVIGLIELVVSSIIQ